MDYSQNSLKQHHEAKEHRMVNAIFIIVFMIKMGKLSNATGQRIHSVLDFVGHYCDAMMGTVASQVTSLTIVYTTVYSDADQSKHQSSASLAFVWGVHRGPVNSPHKWPVMRKMFPFDDVIMVQWNLLITRPIVMRGLRPANERRRYKVTPPLIGWAQT